MDSWTARYSAQNPTAMKGWIDGGNMLKKILSFPGADGIWIFKGVDAKGQQKIVFMPADAKGKVLAGGGSDQLMPCPPYCGRIDNVATIGAPIDATVADQWIEAYQNQNHGKVYAHLL